MENLKEQEAIKDIDNSLEFGAPDGLKKETLLLAKSALEKQIPKKPIDRCMFSECPNCGNVEIQDMAHCPDCGQGYCSRLARFWYNIVR